MREKSKNKKGIVIQVIRGMIQLVSFILLPGLFITIFSGFGEIIGSIVAGTFVFAEQIPNIFLLASVMTITFLWGRFFCGFICSFGAMQDLLWLIGRHIPFHPVISQKTDRILKYLKYVVLAGIIVFVWVLGITFNSLWSPWTVFGMYSSPWKGLPVQNALISIGGIILLVVMIGSLFIERFFCKYLCPLGAVFSPVSRFKLFKIKRDSSKCSGSCMVCTRKCSMSIPLYEHEDINSGECINCLKCTSVCANNNIKVQPVQAASATVAAATFAGIAYAGVLRMTNGTVSASDNNIIVNENGKTYADTSTTDKEKTQNSISKKHSGKSSKDKQNSKSETNNQMPNEENEGSSDNAESSKPNPGVSDGHFADGTYTGTGSGFRGTTKVSVTVNGGNITDITVISYQDDDRFFSRAESSVISQILSSQSVDVDTVSGATFSSNSIIEAVSNALGQEFINPNAGSASKGKKH